MNEQAEHKVLKVLSNQWVRWNTPYLERDSGVIGRRFVLTVGRLYKLGYVEKSTKKNWYRDPVTYYRLTPSGLKERAKLLG